MGELTDLLGYLLIELPSLAILFLSNSPLWGVIAIVVVLVFLMVIARRRRSRKARRGRRH